MATVERIPPGERQTWYFTFGFAHGFANRYFVVRDATFAEARDRMLATFGQQWAFQYDEADWFKHGVSQAEKYGLTELPGGSGPQVEGRDDADARSMS